MDWRATPGPDALKSIGSNWAKAGRSALLVVPSAVTPSETHLLLNPDTTTSRGSSCIPPKPVVFDPPLRKRTP
jgi:RES domain-containing protein